MREIKFRGKYIDGKWIYGSYVEEKHLSYEFDDTNEYVYAFIHHKPDDWTSPYHNVPVIPETVGQYTGLKDKNGTEIYEGDIVGCFGNTQFFEVKYCPERGGFFLDDVIMCGEAEPSPECLGNMLDTVEVVGNKYDNPELLKEV